MKNNVLSLVLLCVTSAVNAQTIERIVPSTGYHSWKNLRFTNTKTGFAETESGKTFSTTDGGKSWAEDVVNKSENSKEIPSLKKIPLGGRTGDVFLALSKIADTLYVGRTSNYNPYIILAGDSGKYWKVLNGATYNSVSSLWAGTSAMTIADNFGNAFYSDDNGRSFTKTKTGNNNCWPEIKEHNGSLYYIDGSNRRFIVSRDFGKTWIRNDFIRHDREVVGAYVDNDSIRYFIADNSLIECQHNFSVKTTIATLEGRDKFVKLSQHGNKAVAISKRGSVFLYKNDHWTKKVIDTTTFFTGVAYDGTKIAITTAANKVYLSEDGNSFIPLLTPLSGHNSYHASFYDKYLIIEIRDTRSMKGNMVFIYNTELKTSVIRTIDTLKYSYGTTGHYKNYIFGTLGSIHKIVDFK